MSQVSSRCFYLRLHLVARKLPGSQSYILSSTDPKEKQGHFSKLSSESQGSFKRPGHLPVTPRPHPPRFYFRQNESVSSVAILHIPRVNQCTNLVYRPISEQIIVLRVRGDGRGRLIDRDWSNASLKQSCS